MCTTYYTALKICTYPSPSYTIGSKHHTGILPRSTQSLRGSFKLRCNLFVCMRYAHGIRVWVCVCLQVVRECKNMLNQQCLKQHKIQPNVYLFKLSTSPLFRCVCVQCAGLCFLALFLGCVMHSVLWMCIYVHNFMIAADVWCVRDALLAYFNAVPIAKWTDH